MATLLHPISIFLNHRWKFKSKYFKSTMRTMNENNKMTWLRAGLQWKLGRDIIQGHFQQCLWDSPHIDV